MENTDFIPITEYLGNINERFSDESDPVKDMGIGATEINFSDIAYKYLRKYADKDVTDTTIKWCLWLRTLEGKIIQGNFKYKYVPFDMVFEDSLKIVKIDSYGFGGPYLRLTIISEGKEPCEIQMKQNYFITGLSKIGLIENVNESALIDYMKQVADMFKGQRQSDFWQWKVDNAKELKHVKTDEIRKQYPEIDEYLNNSRHQIIQKECFKNAGQLCINCEGVDYVEGEISYHGIPIEHAWNKIDDKYFDITKDVLFSNKSDYAEYVSIIELDTEEYSHMIFKHKHWGGFVQEKYAEEKKSVFEGVADKYRTPIMKNPKSLEEFYPRLNEVSHNKIGKFNFKDFEKWDAGGIDHIDYKDNDKLIDKNPMPKKSKENNDRGKKITYKQSQDFGKKLIVTTKDDINIYFVDGTLIRDVKGKGFDIDFTMGGHAYIYPHYIPEDEVWIDKNMNKEDKYTTIVHELTERKEMKDMRAPYDKAHDNASVKEEKVRKKIEKKEGEDK